MNQTLLESLKSLSVHVGSNPLLVQAAGGNSSVKQDDVLWIKASGTWLMHAEQRNIMVPVDYPTLMDALEREDPGVEKAQDFVIADQNPSNLRPSIETTLHAVMQHRIVVHVHCVNTIAVAVRDDAESVLADKLVGIDYVFVPYVRPGLPLASLIKRQLKPQTNVVVLGNHGLVVGADTTREAQLLVHEIHQRLSAPARSAPPPDLQALTRLCAGSDYAPATDAISHRVACDPVSCRIAHGGSLYPDHVIFLGHGSLVIDNDESAADVSTRITQRGLPAPVSIVYADRGVVMQQDASDAAQAMALCLSDVTSRVANDATITYLSLDQNAELLNWDAEQYRQALMKQYPDS